MSRLGAALKAVDTRERKSLREPMRYMDAKVESQEIVAAMAIAYRITAVFAVNTTVPISSRNGLFAMQEHQALEVAKLQIIRDVFGEYQGPLREVIHLIYAMEYDAALDLVKRVADNLDSTEPFTRNASTGTAP